MTLSAPQPLDSQACEDQDVCQLMATLLSDHPVVRENNPDSACSTIEASQNADDQPRHEGASQWAGFFEKDSKILVDNDTQRTILSFSEGFLEQFGFKSQDLYGRALRVIQGPLTDKKNLAYLMKENPSLQEVRGRTANVVLYTTDAKELEFRVTTCSTTFLGRHAWILELSPPAEAPEAEPQPEAKPTDAVLLSGIPKHLDPIQEVEPEVVVSLNPPHHLLEFNDGFLGFFLFKRPDLLKCTLRILQGPATDKTRLASLIASAARRGAGAADPAADAAAAAVEAVTLYRKDGEEAACRIRATPAAHGGGAACLLQLEGIDSTALR